MTSLNRTLASTLGVLSVAAICAQEVTVLESFEDNIDAASLMNWGGRTALDPVGVTLFQSLSQKSGFSERVNSADASPCTRPRVIHTSIWGKVVNHPIPATLLLLLSGR